MIRKMLQYAWPAFSQLEIVHLSTLVLAIACSSLILATYAGDAGGNSYPQDSQKRRVASGLSSPTAMDFAPDGRLFVCLQGGQLRVIKNGSLLPTPFISLTVDSNGERGLARAGL